MKAKLLNIKKRNIILAILLLPFVSCSKNSVEENWLMDEKLKSHLLDFPLDYQVNVPGISLSYPTLWYGYDANNKYGPKLDSSSRFYTFETEYLAKSNEDYYYACYVKSNELETLTNYAKEYQDKNKDNSNFFFSDYTKQEIIDGKFLLPIKLNKLDIQTYFLKTSKLEELSFMINDKQLIFAIDSKKAVINENLSTKENIKKEVTLFNPLYLTKDTNKKVSQLEIDKGFYKASNANFNYIGKKIETFPLNYKYKSILSLPLNGLDNNSYKTKSIEVITKDNKEQILIPRYQKDTNGDFSYDSLYQAYDKTSNYIDIYGKNQEEFKKALISNAEANGNYKYAYFDYEKVKDIIE